MAATPACPEPGRETAQRTPGATKRLYRLLGIQNFASNIAGIISPFVIGLLLDLYDGSYVPAFAVAAGVAVAGAATYAFVVGRAEPLPPLAARGRSAHADVT